MLTLRQFLKQKIYTNDVVIIHDVPYLAKKISSYIKLLKRADIILFLQDKNFKLEYSFPGAGSGEVSFCPARYFEDRNLLLITKTINIYFGTKKTFEYTPKNVFNVDMDDNTVYL